MTIETIESASKWTHPCDVAKTFDWNGICVRASVVRSTRKHRVHRFPTGACVPIGAWVCLSHCPPCHDFDIARSSCAASPCIMEIARPCAHFLDNSVDVESFSPVLWLMIPTEALSQLCFGMLAKRLRLTVPQGPRRHYFNQPAVAYKKTRYQRILHPILSRFRTAHIGTVSWSHSSCMQRIKSDLISNVPLFASCVWSLSASNFSIIVNHNELLLAIVDPVLRHQLPIIMSLSILFSDN